MSFEEYLNVQLERIAEGAGDVSPDFKDLMDLYLNMVGAGLSPRQAKRIMDAIIYVYVK